MAVRGDGSVLGYEYYPTKEMANAIWATRRQYYTTANFEQLMRERFPSK